MINYAKLPEWLEMEVWADALLRSGMMGTYSFDFDVNNYTIRNPHILQDHYGKDVNGGSRYPRFLLHLRGIDGTVGITTMQDRLVDAVRTAFKKIDPRNNWSLYRYDPEAVEWHRDNGHVSLYEVRKPMTPTGDALSTTSCPTSGMSVLPHGTPRQTRHWKCCSVEWVRPDLNWGLTAPSRQV